MADCVYDIEQVTVDLTPAAESADAHQTIIT